jgi:hypothetical protein
MSENGEGASLTTAQPARVTGDTNLFYYLGAGAIQKHDVVATGEELWATPMNMLEILAGVAGDEWSQRRDAARGIVACADQMSLDPESVFT